MAVRPRAGAHTKTAAVEVIDNRKLAGTGSGGYRFVEAEGEVVLFIEDSVGPEDGAVVMDRDVEVDMV